jgi:hypothetical protein
MSRGLLLLALLLCVAALGLSACGASDSNSSTRPAATYTSSSSESSSKQSGSVTLGRPHPHASAATKVERDEAGNAAAFVEPGADNSVPTFGSEASDTVRSGAEADLRAYLTARAAHNWAKACSLLAASVRQGFEKLATSKAHAGCAKILPVLAPLRAGVPANPLQGSLLAFRIHGANAFALFFGPRGHQRYMVPMNRESGAWRPTQAAPIAYPPGQQAGEAP